MNVKDLAELGKMVASIPMDLLIKYKDGECFRIEDDSLEKTQKGVYDILVKYNINVEDLVFVGEICESLGGLRVWNFDDCPELSDPSLDDGPLLSTFKYKRLFND